MRINHNVTALNSYRHLSVTATALARSVERLSSGQRINRAGDDPAGLVISQALRAQVSGLRQAARNTQDAVSLVQTADGALGEVHTMMTRMRDLAVASANAAATPDARGAANAEIVELRAEIFRIATSTRFGGQVLFDGSFGQTPATLTGVDVDAEYSVSAGDEFTIDINGLGPVTVTMGELTSANVADTATAVQVAVRAALAASGDTAVAAFADKVTVTGEAVGSGSSLTLQVAGLGDAETFVLVDGTGDALEALGLSGTPTAAAGETARFQVGANPGDTIVFAGVDLASIVAGIDGDVLTGPGAEAFITAMDTAIGGVSEARGRLGATQVRLESVLNTLAVTTENVAASESQIRDTDMALEMVAFARHQVLAQAGVAMAAQANLLPQSILRLFA